MLAVMVSQGTRYHDIVLSWSQCYGLATMVHVCYQLGECTAYFSQVMKTWLLSIMLCVEVVTYLIYSASLVISYSHGGM